MVCPKNRCLILLLSVNLMMFGIACRSTKHTHTYSDKGTSGFYKKYSEILGVELSGKEDKKLIEAVSGWLGVKYLYGGNTKKGTDCSGMVGSIYKEVYNINLNRSANDQVKNCDPVNKNNLKTGDLVFFKINNTKVSHVGIYIGRYKFIHASTSKGVIVSNLNEDYYKKYFYSGGRVKKKQ